MDITREMIMALPVEQAIKLHKTVVAYLESNLDTVLGAGLLDEVLYGEYRAGVEKLSGMDCDQQKQTGSLCSLLWPMVETAASNLSAGKTEQVYADFVKCVAESL